MNQPFLLAATWSWSLDGWIVLIGVLCAVSASLLGNFLVLRKLSLLGDAVSHAVLPGLAVAFLVSGSRSSLPMFIGAVVVGLLTAVATEWIRKLGRVDESASMGVVFTTFFALGLLLIVQAADHVDLDAGCVLYGAIELSTFDMVQIGGLEMPRGVAVLVPVLCMNAVFVTLFFKELKICSFDASLASSMGFSSTLMHYSLMMLVAITAVASFERVGNVLVVAMFIVPPATAYLLTDRLSTMVMLSSLIAAVGAVSGHWGAIAIPEWFGLKSTTTAGMMAASTGLIFLLAWLFSPNHGLVFKAWQRFGLSQKVLQDDVVALLFRQREKFAKHRLTSAQLCDDLLVRPPVLRLALWLLQRRGDVECSDGSVSLTEKGSLRAMEIVRSHRLWETYLVEEAKLDSRQIHSQAERLEHFTSPVLSERLDEATGRPEFDPHGSEIPRQDKEAK
jgi:manganese/zinc/iron transport system permease protein